MGKLPTSPEEILQELFEIFPSYRANYPGPIHDEAPNFHSVLIAFAPFLGGAASGASQEQLQAFAALANNAVSLDGELENAFGTCLLEHLGQIDAWSTLKPYLSNAARAKCHA